MQRKRIWQCNDGDAALLEAGALGAVDLRTHTNPFEALRAARHQQQHEMRQARREKKREATEAAKAHSAATQGAAKPALFADHTFGLGGSGSGGGSGGGGSGGSGGGGFSFDSDPFRNVHIATVHTRSKSFGGDASGVVGDLAGARAANNDAAAAAAARSSIAPTAAAAAAALAGSGGSFDDGDVRSFFDDRAAATQHAAPAQARRNTVMSTALSTVGATSAPNASTAAAPATAMPEAAAAAATLSAAAAATAASDDAHRRSGAINWSDSNRYTQIQSILDALKVPASSSTRAAQHSPMHAAAAHGGGSGDAHTTAAPSVAATRARDTTAAHTTNSSGTSSTLAQEQQLHHSHNKSNSNSNSNTALHSPSLTLFNASVLQAMQSVHDRSGATKHSSGSGATTHGDSSPHRMGSLGDDWREHLGGGGDGSSGVSLRSAAALDTDAALSTSMQRKDATFIETDEESNVILSPRRASWTRKFSNDELHDMERATSAFDMILQRQNHTPPLDRSRSHQGGAEGIATDEDDDDDDDDDDSHEAPFMNVASGKSFESNAFGSGYSHASHLFSHGGLAGVVGGGGGGGDERGGAPLGGGTVGSFAVGRAQDGAWLPSPKNSPVSPRARASREKSVKRAQRGGGNGSGGGGGGGSGGDVRSSSAAMSASRNPQPRSMHTHSSSGTTDGVFKPTTHALAAAAAVRERDHSVASAPVFFGKKSSTHNLFRTASEETGFMKTRSDQFERSSSNEYVRNLSMHSADGGGGRGGGSDRSNDADLLNAKFADLGSLLSDDDILESCTLCIDLSALHTHEDRGDLQSFTLVVQNSSIVSDVLDSIDNWISVNEPLSAVRDTIKNPLELYGCRQESAALPKNVFIGDCRLAQGGDSHFSVRIGGEQPCTVAGCREHSSADSITPRALSSRKANQKSSADTSSSFDSNYVVERATRDTTGTPVRGNILTDSGDFVDEQVVSSKRGDQRISVSHRYNEAKAALSGVTGGRSARSDNLVELPASSPEASISDIVANKTRNEDAKQRLRDLHRAMSFNPPSPNTSMRLPVAPAKLRPPVSSAASIGDESAAETAADGGDVDAMLMRGGTRDLAELQSLRPLRSFGSNEAAALYIQKWWRGYKARRLMSAERQRKRAVVEMRTSEEVYIRSLRDAVAVFYEPLLRAAAKKKPLMPAEDAHRVFSAFKRILPLSEELFDNLSERTAFWTIDSSIADVFLKTCSSDDFYAAYESHTAAYYVALEIVESCKKRNPKFKTWLERAEKLFWSSTDSGNSLQAFLILPIQRLARYVLLLRSVKQFTREDHPDYVELDYALKIMEKCVAAVNETERYRDTERKRLLELKALHARLQQHVPGFITDAIGGDGRLRRWLVHEGNVRLLNVLESKLKPRHYFLLSDVMLLCKVMPRQKKKDLFLRYLIALDGVRQVRATNAASLTSFGSVADEMHYAVEIMTDTAGVFLSFDSAEARSVFLGELRGVLTNLGRQIAVHHGRRD